VAESGRLGLGDDILQTLGPIGLSSTSDVIGLQSYRILWKKTK